MPVKRSENYFEAGLAILDEQGVKALTIAALCDGLGVTKGSFYHHFAGWEAFVAGLLEYWEAEQTERIIDLANRDMDPISRLETLVELASIIPHGAENAIRVWSANDPVVAEVQLRVDKRRLEYAVGVIDAVVEDPERSRSLAMMAFSMFVGLQQMVPRLNSSQTKQVLHDFMTEVVLRLPPGHLPDPTAGSAGHPSESVAAGGEPDPE